MFCLLPFQLLGSCVPSKNYGHVKRIFTMQAALKTAFGTTISRFPNKNPCYPGQVGEEEWDVRVIVIPLMCCGPSVAVKCLSPWGFEDRVAFKLLRSRSHQEILHWKQAPRSHPYKESDPFSPS